MMAIEDCGTLSVVARVDMNTVCAAAVNVATVYPCRLADAETVNVEPGGGDEATRTGGGGGTPAEVEVFGEALCIPAPTPAPTPAATAATTAHMTATRRQLGRRGAGFAGSTSGADSTRTVGTVTAAGVETKRTSPSAAAAIAARGVSLWKQ